VSHFFLSFFLFSSGRGGNPRAPFLLSLFLSFHSLSHKKHTKKNTHSVLYGALAVRSFDWADAEGAGGPPPTSTSTSTGSRPATLVADAVLSASSPPTVLRPATGGNIHAFAAVDPHPTAVLDLLAPPYSGDGEEGGRDCAYFCEEENDGKNAAPLPWPAPDPARLSVPGAAVRLAPMPAPAWFRVEHGTYRGARADGPGSGSGGSGGGSGGAPGRGTRRARE
jgi:hypothetical protein